MDFIPNRMSVQEKQIYGDFQSVVVSITIFIFIKFNFTVVSDLMV